MKRGFTLIEVLVVIVILGVLAVVATPKLFGQIAKAKASEVPIAAGIYVKLQDAHLAEKEAIGNWHSIGFLPPGNGQTENFKYGDCIESDIPRENFSTTIGLKISSLINLNNCPTNSLWAVSMIPSGENQIDFKRLLSSDKCLALTGSWDLGEIDGGNCSGKTPSSASSSSSKTESSDSKLNSSSSSAGTSSSNAESSNSKAHCYTHNGNNQIAQKNIPKEDCCKGNNSECDQCKNVTCPSKGHGNN